ncbi:uncharacterized [Tachysurus ichikawai]
MHGSTRWNVRVKKVHGGAEGGRNAEECSKPTISHESLEGLACMSGGRTVRTDTLQELKLEADPFLLHAPVLQLDSGEQAVK